MSVPLLDGIGSDLAIATPHDTVDEEITLTGAWPSSVSSPLAVDDCAVASVAACLATAAQLAVVRGANRPHVELDRGHVAAVMRSEAWLRDPSGREIGAFAPIFAAVAHRRWLGAHTRELSLAPQGVA